MRKLEKEELKDALGVVACSFSLKGKAKRCAKCEFVEACRRIASRVKSIVESVEKSGRRRKTE